MSELKIKQKEGIETAKKLGLYRGRKPSIDRDKVKELWKSGMNGTEISKEMKIHRGSLYRILNELGYNFEVKWKKKRSNGKRSDFERVSRDYYPTPYDRVLPLISHLPQKPFSYAEPCGLVMVD